MKTEIDYTKEIKEHIKANREAIRSLYGVECAHEFRGGISPSLEDFADLGEVVNRHFSNDVNCRGFAILTRLERVASDIIRNREFQYDGRTINPRSLVSSAVSADVKGKIVYSAAPNMYVPGVGFVGVLIAKPLSEFEPEPEVGNSRERNR